MRHITVEAKIEHLDQVQDFVRRTLHEFGWGTDEIRTLELVVEELFVNICSYAYPQKTGKAGIGLERLTGPEGVKIEFRDQGIPYNPLERELPDIGQGALERPVGGLGIYFARKLTDAFAYSGENGENRLTMVKYKKEE